ncbi:MAG: SH3 domain-containing protein [Syntrophobacteraceae bacterium]
MIKMIKILSSLMVSLCLSIGMASYAFGETVEAGASAVKVEIIKKSVVRAAPSLSGRVVGTMQSGVFDVTDTATVGSTVWFKITSRKYGPVWIASTNTNFVESGLTARPSAVSTLIDRPISGSESRDLEALSHEISSTIDRLKEEDQKILAGLEAASERRCSDEAKKVVVGMSYESSPVKDKSLSALASEISLLSKQIDSLVEGYKKKDAMVKGLSDKLAEVNRNKKILAEIQAIVGAPGGVGLTVDVPDDSAAVAQLNKRINAALSLSAEQKTDPQAKEAPVAIPVEATSTAPAVLPAAAPAAPLKPEAANAAVQVPKWVIDTVRLKGHAMRSDHYGPVTVVKEAGVTIMVIKKDGVAKFRDVYSKMIKESYEADGSFYFVMNMPAERG